jgi:hypothetical protein
LRIWPITNTNAVREKWRLGATIPVFHGTIRSMPSLAKPNNAKPLVQVACVCEKVLIEPDKVASVIRIVDTSFLDIPPDPLPSGMEPAISLTAFIALKSGDVAGNFDVGIRLRRPEETKEGEIRKWPVEFRGEESGVHLRIDFVVKEPKLGLYWWDVLWGDDVLTRIPFRLKTKESAPTGDAVVPSEIALK